MILYIYYKYMHSFLDTANVNRMRELSVYLLMLLWLLTITPSLPAHWESLSVFLMVFLLTWQYEAPFVKKLLLALFIYGSYVFCMLFTGYLLILFDRNMRTDTFAAAQSVLFLIFMYLGEQLAEFAAERAGRLRRRLAESERAKRQLLGYANQMAVMKRSEEKVRGLRHDLKHHLNELMFLAERDDASEIKEYIKSMDAFMTYSREYVSSGNTDIDSLLNLTLDFAKKELCDVSCKVSIPRELAIKPFDLNVILGNLLDNAIFAAKQTPEQYLKVRISYKPEMLLILIENSYQGSVHKYKGQYRSTKKDGLEHGLGLENVRHVVEQYDGSMEITDENQLFRVKAVLYVPAQKERISP